jgi:flavin reductase (DIM6/NTAB) family NADH-FMN oxidoreductase RutF
MFIVTTLAGDEMAGCLVGFATQVSIDPPRFLACLSRENRTFAVAQNARWLAVHVVPADRHDLAELFGSVTGDEDDKLASCDWSPGPHGLPIIEGCRSWIAGPIVSSVELGDHWGFAIEPQCYGDPGVPPLTNREVGDIRPGHQP